MDAVGVLEGVGCVEDAVADELGGFDVVGVDVDDAESDVG